MGVGFGGRVEGGVRLDVLFSQKKFWGEGVGGRGRV